VEFPTVRASSVQVVDATLRGPEQLPLVKQTMMPSTRNQMFRASAINVPFWILPFYPALLPLCSVTPTTSTQSTISQDLQWHSCHLARWSLSLRQRTCRE
jgi:hypothetical protein